ncbi:MAG: undecaprenyldiphospho-muramoylpentapeptide beta-N-acetylglucosaminyltransferase [Desulfomonile tiedjei]|nr:undecaprenyldiphospho-muramoylpentapeptide beta-N-acetylglucosaminyltransferase [Desulfomonile tiedjei]
MRLLVAGGGTGGHLFPALAVARAMKREEASAEVLFVGTKHGIEAKIIPGTEFPIRFITAHGMRKTGILNTLRGAVEIPLGVIQSLGLIREFRPSVALGVGGYASGPTVAAALLLRVPTAIQEQNSVMGTTNRLLARFVDRIFTSWEKTDPPPPAQKTLLAGNPVREDVVINSGPEPNPERFNILIFGGSRGARSINLAVAENLDVLAPIADRISIRHQTGVGVADEIGERYRNAGITAEATEFIHEMGPAYRWADLVVCRSGASSLAEITALGKAAIVIPYPYAIGDHQAKNARELESRGAVRTILDKDLGNAALVKEIRRLVEQPEARHALSENSRKLGRPDAARTIARELITMERNRR